LTLEVEPIDRPIWVRTDRVKLARVLGNLLGNAIKFTAHGHVRVGARLEADRRLVIRVADTGLGIAPDDQAFIFDEFTQLRNPARDREKGTGLGLAICKRLVEVIGGTIEVESAAGRGSTFVVTLPPSCVALRLDATLGPRESPKPERASPRGQALAGLRVLLVEDHAATRDSTAQILQDEGADVRPAVDGTTALARIEEGGADVILLDMMLPDLDGREVLRRIAGCRPDGLRAVIVMTGDLTAARLDEVRHLGADALIGKPIDVSKLIDVLQPLRIGGNGR
jgi:CheY-like chemotaxis protein/anti-sigma regulatory factor (Ser/Thr protein kinase)